MVPELAAGITGYVSEARRGGTSSPLPDRSVPRVLDHSLGSRGGIGASWPQLGAYYSLPGKSLLPPTKGPPIPMTDVSELPLNPDNRYVRHPPRPLTLSGHPTIQSGVGQGMCINKGTQKGPSLLNPKVSSTSWAGGSPRHLEP